MKDNSVARDYAVGTVLVILLLAVSFLIIRFTNGLVEPQVSGAVGAVEAPAAPAVMVSQTVPTTREASFQLPPKQADRVTLLTGRFDPATDSNFVRLDDRYTDGDGDYLVRRETAVALREMIDAAAEDGVDLNVRSATRNHARQSQIWGAKWRGDRTLSNGVNLGTAGFGDSLKARMILLYSSMPGTSRHHWGTDVDFNAFENDYFASGRGLAEYTWLKRHAGDFGFLQPYTSKAGGRTGYEEERWHWSYAPLSVPFLQAYRTDVSYADIGGFDGAEVAETVGAIEEYVEGVAAELR